VSSGGRPHDFTRRAADDTERWLSEKRPTKGSIVYYVSSLLILIAASISWALPSPESSVFGLLRLSVLIDSKIVEHSAASDHVSATFAGADDAVPNTDDLDDRLQQNAVYLRRQHNDRR